MSERINVDHAFDPEARQAQAEFDAYMDSRPYKDEKGNIHNPENGKFANYDDYMEQQRDDHYDETLEQGDYSGESLEQLARRVAQARAEGDKTRAMDAEEAFFNKFAAYSDKYGWEEEDGSADGPHVDKDAKLGRRTIDDRLERYTKIMYGEEESTNSADNEIEPTAEHEFVIGDTVRVKRTSGDIEDDWKVSEISEDGKTVIVRKPAPDGNGVLRKDISVGELRNLQKDGLDNDSQNDISVTDLTPEPALENESQEEYEARHGVQPTSGEETPFTTSDQDELQERLSADDLEILDEEGNSASSSADDLEEIPVDRRSRLQRLRNALTPAGAAAEASAWAATRRERNDGSERTKRQKMLAGFVLFGGAIAGGLLLMKGHDIFSHSHGSHSGSGDHSGQNWWSDLLPKQQSTGGATSETIRVNPGDGEIKVLQHILANHGVHVDTTQAQHIGEHANLHDILQSDHSYAHSGSSMDRIGDVGTFKIRAGVVDKALASARELGIK